MLFSLLQVVMVLYYTARPGLSIEVRRYHSGVGGVNIPFTFPK